VTAKYDSAVPTAENAQLDIHPDFMSLTDVVLLQSYDSLLSATDYFYGFLIFYPLVIDESK
jgi:hypothetical protein